MKRILFQSDDYGLSYAVTDGIIKGIKDGIIRNTGLFVNMDCSEYAVREIENIDVCLGLDVNYVAGKPVTDQALVPHLVDADGNFISSRTQIKHNKLVSLEGIVFHFENDPYPYEEILLETENQVKRFVELVGKMPEYIHPHSLCTPNTERAAKVIAEKYHIFHSVNMMFSSKYKDLAGVTSMSDSKGSALDAQMNADIEKEILEQSFPALGDGETGYYICHCGYVDYDLFLNSSLTLRRIRDLSAALSSKVKEYLQENDIELITYRELK